MGKRHDGVGQWRQWTEEQGRRALQDLAASGESTAGFARRRGISPQRVAYWRRRLAKTTKTAFVAVALPTATSARWIEIAAAGVIVRIREDLDVRDVARLVEALGARVGAGC